jgi:hypothetical protein
VQILDWTIWHQEANLVVLTFAHGCGFSPPFQKYMTVIAVNAIVNLLQGRWRITGKPEDPKGFFGKRNLVRIEAPGKAAALTQPLGCCQKVLFAAQFFLRPLTIFDIDIRAVPFDDPALFIAQRVCTKEEPSILSVMPAQSRYSLFLFSGRRGALPFGQQIVQVIGVDRLRERSESGRRHR